MFNCARPHPRGFTLIELLITVGIIVFLASIITPALTMARDGANSAMCRSRLNEWGKAYGQYLLERNDKFHKGDSVLSKSSDDLWVKALSPYIKDKKVLFCPQATQTETEGGRLPNMAWELSQDPYYKTLHEEGLGKGSYCLNWWVNNAEGSGNASGYYWRSSQSSDAKKIPVLADGGDYTASVYSSGKNYKPTPVAIDANMSERTFKCYDNITRFLMNRHSGEINVLFMDWSVRSTPLTELWELNWHKGYKPVSYENASWQWPGWITGESEQN